MKLDEMKPRILQPLNGPVIIENIKKKIVAYARKHGINLGEIDSWTDGDIQYINVENNTGSHHFVEEIVENDRHVDILRIKHYPGHFDWAADTYIKDTTMIGFKLQHP